MFFVLLKVQAEFFFAQKILKESLVSDADDYENHVYRNNESCESKRKTTSNHLTLSFLNHHKIDHFIRCEFQYDKVPWLTLTCRSRKKQWNYFRDLKISLRSSYASSRRTSDTSTASFMTFSNKFIHFNGSLAYTHPVNSNCAALCCCSSWTWWFFTSSNYKQCKKNLLDLKKSINEETVKATSLIFLTLMDYRLPREVDR